MNNSLKVIERMIESLHTELKIAADSPEISEKSYTLLKDAVIDAINLKRKVEVARAWNLSK